MTSRERVQAVLNGKKPDRQPFNFWMDRNRMAELDKKLGEEIRITHYGADVLEAFPWIDWSCGLPTHYQTDEKTSWQTAPTLERMEDAYTLKFPQVKGNEDEVCGGFNLARRTFPDVAIWAMIITPLDCFFNLRMMENAMYDFFDYPEECEYIINEYSKRLYDIVCALDRCDVDALYLAGDICSSIGPMFSEDMLRKYCFEPIKPAIDKAHELGLPVFYHTDGAVEKVLPLIVEYGIDGINPLQPTINDCAAFAEKYGDKLMLYCGIDNCFAIPDGTPESVREHILSQYNILGKGRGLIFSSHDIPDYVPQENVDAMVEAIKSIKP